MFEIVLAIKIFSLFIIFVTSFYFHFRSCFLHFKRVDLQNASGMSDIGLLKGSLVGSEVVCVRQGLIGWGKASFLMEKINIQKTYVKPNLNFLIPFKSSMASSILSPIPFLLCWNLALVFLFCRGSKISILLWVYCLFLASSSWTLSPESTSTRKHTLLDPSAWIRFPVSFHLKS